jgi:DNA-binding CsgD family transcriptional regulator
MGKPREPWREALYGHEKSRTLASRLYVLLRDELGLGRQPKVARLLVDEIVAVVESTLVDAGMLKPGQVLVLAPEVGQGPSWNWRRLEDKRMKAVRLTLIDPADIDRLVAGDPLPKVRLERLARLTQEAFEQGATLTACQLGLMTGITPSWVCEQLNTWMKEHDEVLPLRGVVEDCSPAVTHKAGIVALHLKGRTTAEIARATNHTPRSVERYLQRFEQVRELVRYLDRVPDPSGIARILGCSERLVRAYLDLMPKETEPGAEV